MSELLPCPFCGGEAEYALTFAGEEATCKTCHAAMPRTTTKQNTIDAWNTRSESTCGWFEDGVCRKGEAELHALADGQQVIILPVTKLKTPVFQVSDKISIADAANEYGRFLADNLDYEIFTQSLNNAGWFKERTCKNMFRFGGGFECSCCGYLLDDDDSDSGVYFEFFNYCPRCGAKVVE